LLTAVIPEWDVPETNHAVDVPSKGGFFWQFGCPGAVPLYNFSLLLRAGDCVCLARWEKVLRSALKYLLCSAAQRAQISAGVPEWQGLTPTLEKVTSADTPWTCATTCSRMQVGAENIRLGWPVPLSGGSPILGYHVDMEALQPARAVAFSEVSVPRAPDRPTEMVAGRGSTMVRSF